MERIWSSYQHDVFDKIGKNNKSIIVKAYAGSAKTTTMVEGMKYANGTKLFLAFNKAIQLELDAKIGTIAQVKTLNGLGHGIWARYVGRINLDDKKIEKIIRNNTDISRMGKTMMYGILRRMVTWCKTYGLVPNGKNQLFSIIKDDSDTWARYYTKDIETEIKAKLGKFGITENSSKIFNKLVNDCRIALSLSIEDISTIDYNDQIYMPVIFRASAQRFDWVFVDELQDLSEMNMELVALLCCENTKFIGVGDPHQRIYGWRGAAQNTMASFKRRFDAIEAELPVCYRCPQEVIKMAQTYVPAILPWEKAETGRIDFIKNISPADLEEGDLVLHKNNAPLLLLAMATVASGKRVSFFGRDILKDIEELVDTFYCNDIASFKVKIRNWYKQELDRIEKTEANEDKAPLDEKFFSIMAITRGMDDYDRVEGIIEYARRSFSKNSKDSVIFSTVHRAKGFEAKNVFIMEINDMEKIAEVNEEMKNLLYVAITRSKSNLFYTFSEENKNE